MKICSTSLIIREMQVKTTLRFYLIPVRISRIKNSGDSSCWQGCGERRNTPPLLVGLQAGTTTLEINLAIFFQKKWDIDTTWQNPALSLLRQTPKRYSTHHTNKDTGSSIFIAALFIIARNMN